MYCRLNFVKSDTELLMEAVTFVFTKLFYFSHPRIFHETKDQYFTGRNI
jgi:hypothetical protein